MKHFDTFVIMDRVGMSRAPSVSLVCTCDRTGEKTPLLRGEKRKMSFKIPPAWRSPHPTSRRLLIVLN